MEYKDKMRQAGREARASVMALALTIVVWVVLGFGLSGLDVKLFHTPLWIITGCVGTWIFAIIVSVYLSKRVFKDVGLEDVEPTEEGNGVRDDDR